MKSPTQQSEIATAEILGTIAFNSGKKCIPALDADLMKMMEGKEVGEGLPLMKAWTKTWHNANLAKSPKQEIASQICNMVGVVDLYPNLYQMAWNVQYKGKMTIAQKKELTNYQSSDIRKLGYVPAILLTALKAIA